MNFKNIIFINLLLLLNACGGGDEQATAPCPPYVATGITIDVFDKETGNKISCGAIATIQDINYIEELVNPIGNECSDSQPLTGALGRAGTYEIKLTKDGYVDWFVSNIEVSSNRCTVNGMYLQAYLDKVVVKL